MVKAGGNSAIREQVVYLSTADNSSGGSCLEIHGTLFHGQRVSPDLLVWAVGTLAEGLGIRAGARVFEVDPNTVLQWLVEAAEQLQAFSQYILHDVHVTQGQLDALFALRSAVKAGEISASEAIQRLSRSPYWVWVALDPVSTLMRAMDVGDRTLAMAQSVVHQVVQVLAPGCVPLFLTDGFKAYTTAPPSARRPVDPACAPPGPRATPQAALDAATTAARRPGGQNHTTAPPGARAPSRGVRDHRGRSTGLSGVGLAEQHGVY
jgi:hypothetical protein